MAPSETPSVIISPVEASSCCRPLRRMPMRLASSVPTNGCSRKFIRAEEEKLSHCGPFVTRIFQGLLEESFHPTVLTREVRQPESSPIGRTSPLRNALPSNPPSPLSRCVDRLPSAFGTSIPPRTQR